MYKPVSSVALSVNAHWIDVVPNSATFRFDGAATGCWIVKTFETVLMVE